MPNSKKPVSGHAASMLDWRARQIDDPVARLRYLREASQQASALQMHWTRNRKIIASIAAVAALGIAAFALLPKLSSTTRKATPAASVQAASAAVANTRPAPLPDVWQVEKTPTYEVYSNGLRIETEGVISEVPRRYIALDRKHPEDWKRAGLLTNFRTDPVGIVFHTTESDVLPFQREHSQNLKRAGENVLAYVRNIRAYHYLIDRFGRVHRALAEEGIANHAGWSIWADSSSVYINLNQSFLAIAFEAQTRPQDGSETITDAQLHAGRVLTGMLRAKYKIRGENCTTHAQVSVNPSNWLIGAHTDWATHFPYEEMGLPDNYSTPIPAITEFGFSYDPGYIQVSEARLWKGLLFADDELRKAANAQKLKVSPYKVILNQRFTETIAALKLK